MTFRYVLAICGAILPIVCMATSRDIECQNWTKLAIEKPAVGCEAACAQAKRFDKFNYHSALIEAYSNRAGLRRFVEYAARSSIVGAGADEQACHFYALLLKWGDSTFAGEVSASGMKAKKQVVALLDYSAVENFKARFPRTYGLVAQHDE